MAAGLSASTRAVLGQQRWVFGLRQVEELGISRRTITREVRDRTWRRLTRRTVLALPIDPSPDHLRMAAVLDLGPRATLGGTAALIEVGWTGKDAGRTDVIVSRGTNLAAHPVPRWIRPHYADVNDVGVSSLPMTSAARSTVDAACWARTDREAAFLILSVVQQRVAEIRLLREEIRRRRNIRRLSLIREVIEQAAAGTHSIPELNFAKACSDRHLPQPRRQTRRRDANGMLRYTDAEFDLPDGGILIVEIDGAGHLGAEQSGADTVRNSALARATGAHVLRVTTFVLRHDPEPFFAELAHWLLGPPPYRSPS